MLKSLRLFTAVLVIPTLELQPAFAAAAPRTSLAQVSRSIYFQREAIPGEILNVLTRFRTDPKSPVEITSGRLFDRFEHNSAKTMGGGTGPVLDIRTATTLVLQGYKPTIAINFDQVEEGFSAARRLHVDPMLKWIYAQALSSLWSEKPWYLKILNFFFSLRRDIPIHTYRRVEAGPVSFLRTGEQLILAISEELECDFFAAALDLLPWRPDGVSLFTNKDTEETARQMLAPLIAIVKAVFRHELGHWRFRRLPRWIPGALLIDQSDEYLRVRKDLISRRDLLQDMGTEYIMRKEDGFKGLRRYWQKDLAPIEPLRGQARRRAIWRLAGRIVQNPGPDRTMGSPNEDELYKEQAWTHDRLREFSEAFDATLHESKHAWLLAWNLATNDLDLDPRFQLLELAADFFHDLILLAVNVRVMERMTPDDIPVIGNKFDLTRKRIEAFLRDFESERHSLAQTASSENLQHFAAISELCAFIDHRWASFLKLNGRFNTVGTRQNKSLEESFQPFKRIFGPGSNYNRFLVITEQWAPDMGAVWMDPHLLGEIWLNLLQNAQYAAVQKKGAPVHIEGAREGNWAIVTVSDKGSGMSEETLNRIFEKHFTTKKSGSGIGLWLVREIIEKAGGTIEAASKLGEGTTFTIRLPIIAANPSPGRTGPSAQIRRADEIVFSDEPNDFVRFRKGSELWLSRERRIGNRPIAHIATGNPLDYPGAQIHSNSRVAVLEVHPQVIEKASHDITSVLPVLPKSVEIIYPKQDSVPRQRWVSGILQSASVSLFMAGGAWSVCCLEAFGSILKTLIRSDVEGKLVALDFYFIRRYLYGMPLEGQLFRSILRDYLLPLKNFGISYATYIDGVAGPSMGDLNPFVRLFVQNNIPSPLPVSISQVKPDDFARLADEISPHLVGGPYVNTWLWRHIYLLVKGADALAAFVAKAGGRIVGVRIVKKPRAIPELGLYAPLEGSDVVEEQAQNYGIGSRLRIAAFQYLRDLGYPLYVADVEAGLPRSVKSFSTALKIMGVAREDLLRVQRPRNVLRLRSA